MKPDLVAVMNGVATIMDVSIVGDGQAGNPWLNGKDRLSRMLVAQ